MISIIKRTKCVTTLGPASNSADIIQQLVESGSSCARLNFSHGSHDEHLARILMIKQVSKQLNMPVAIMLDTKGPEVRTHTFIKGSAEIKKNEIIMIIDNEEIIGTPEKFSVNYSNLAKDIKVNNNLLVDDGKLTLKVTAVKDHTVICQALNTHTIKDRRAINIPNVKLSLPFISEKDKADLIFGCQQKVDYVAASFVCSAADIKAIRKVLDDNDGKHIQIIAKIESQLAVNNFDEILKESDAIMVARGDLGVEIPFEKVPFLEREWIKKCHNVNKPIIVATQMLDSMIDNPHPTRAEVTDVWIAMNWGATCTMLSGESANGNYPILSIATMSKILVDAESHQEQSKVAADLLYGNDQLVAKTIKIIIEEKPQYVITNSQDSKYILTIANAHLPVYIIPIVENVINYNKFAINSGIYTFLANEGVSSIALGNPTQLVKSISNSYIIPTKAKVLVVDVNNSTKPFTTFIAK
ncbi:pyruvate kinase [Spiroplasma endosymbiont of Polydrusus pterygomalis]|uniref:pyruvate kinase n=1 Tax=Spiroplasma endosymbiont of Polydrusus pterygomalis TaxID=3139327 RepID=UPI003CCAEE79